MEESGTARPDDRGTSQGSEDRFGGGGSREWTNSCPRVSLRHLGCLASIVAIDHFWGHSEGKASRESEKLDW